MQTAELANAPATSSIKLVKSSAKSNKKSSPFDDIRKDLDALYVLLKLKWKEEEAADNHDSEDELSSETSVANNPYYPYNKELFGHNEKDTPDLAKIDSPIFLACTMAKMLQYLPLVKS